MDSLILHMCFTHFISFPCSIKVFITSFSWGINAYELLPGGEKAAALAWKAKDLPPPSRSITMDDAP